MITTTPKIAMSPLLIDIIISLHVTLQSEKKVCAWLLTKNLNFGGLAPIHLINVGKGSKVLEFVNDSTESMTIR